MLARLVQFVRESWTNKLHVRLPVKRHFRNSQVIQPDGSTYPEQCNKKQTPMS